MHDYNYEEQYWHYFMTGEPLNRKHSDYSCFLKKNKLQQYRNTFTVHVGWWL